MTDYSCILRKMAAEGQGYFSEGDRLHLLNASERIAELEAALSERDEVLEKARKLANNVGGAWRAFGEDLRMGLGTTNYSCMKDAIEAFDAAYLALNGEMR